MAAPVCCSAWLGSISYTVIDRPQSANHYSTNQANAEPNHKSDAPETQHTTDHC